MRTRKPYRRWQGKPRLDFFRLTQIRKNSENRHMAVMGKIVWGDSAISAAIRGTVATIFDDRFAPR